MEVPGQHMSNQPSLMWCCVLSIRLNQFIVLVLYIMLRMFRPRMLESFLSLTKTITGIVHPASQNDAKYTTRRYAKAPLLRDIPPKERIYDMVYWL